MEHVQYIGGCSVLWGIASVHCNMFSTLRDIISSLEGVLYCSVGCISSVLWRMFRTVGDTRDTIIMGDRIQSILCRENKHFS